MSPPVFISYVRDASRADAEALAAKLGDLTFLDTQAIDDGDQFPERLLDGILGARVVVIFATKTYLERRFCRLEMRLALAGGDSAAAQIVLARGEGAKAVFDAMPVAVGNGSWPAGNETYRLETLVRQRLTIGPIHSRLAADDAKRLAAAFLEDATVMPPQPLRGIVCSLPDGMAAQSIGARFVGRAEDLRRIHRTLAEGSGEAAQLTSRIAAGGGFGKTRLAVEYLHRYGPASYPGGLFWVNAASKVLDVEFHRVLQAIEPATPDLAVLRAQQRDVRRELERALRGIGRRALYIIDNIPEAAAGEDPPSMDEFCPALGAVTVLATSRQDSGEANVQTIEVDTLSPGSATLLLTETVPGAAILTWEQWERIAGWVGNLPLALDLLNRSLAMQSVSPRELLRRATSVEPQTAELDSLREALRGQVPKDAVRGITEAFSVSREKLTVGAQALAFVLAQFAAAPIPVAVLDALPEDLKSPAARVALRSRHFVTSSDGSSFGVMHRLMADLLRHQRPEPEIFLIACSALGTVMTNNGCRDPGKWRLMNLLRPHAEELFTRGIKTDATGVAACNLGITTAILARAQGDYMGARALDEQVLEARRRLLEDEHPDTMTSMNNLATTSWAQGEYAKARALYQEVLRVVRSTLGKEHPITLTTMNNLANALEGEGDYAGARALRERALKVRRRVLGKEHPDTLKSLNSLGETLREQGDHARARTLQQQALKTQRRLLGEDHPDTLDTMNNLASTLLAQGDYSGARAFQEQVLEARRRLLGEEHPDTLNTMSNLAHTLFYLFEYDASVQLSQQAHTGSCRILGKNHPFTIAVGEDLMIAKNSFEESKQKSQD